MSPSQPTPPPVRARGVRIARVARWFAFGVLALGLIVVLMSVWLLRSDSGRDFALARVLAVLPADSLSWRSVEGSVSGPLVLHGLRYSRSGLLIEVERAELDLAPLALTGRTLHVEALRLENGRVRLPPGDDAPQPWPRRIELPSALPELQLPLALALDMVSLRAIRVEQGELPLIDVQRFEASGRFERGRLALERLELDSDRAIVRAHGALDTASRWDTGLQASVDVIGIGAEPLPVQLDAQGDWRDLTLTARAALPAPATLTLRIFGGLPDPQWQLGLDAPQIDPLRLGSDGETIALALRGEGDLGRATFDGEFSQGARTVRIEPSTLRLDDGVVQVQPLALRLETGTLEARGTVDLRGDAEVLALDLVAAGLEIPAQNPSARVVVDATARIEGPLSDYGATLDAELRRGDERATLDLQGRGKTSEFRIDTMTLASKRGRIEASGQVAWSPQVEWTVEAALDAFDPSWFAPGFPGAVDARIASQGAMTEVGMNATVRVDPLTGTLRGRALDGDVLAELRADGSGEGEASLRLGDSHVQAQGRWGDMLAVKARVHALRLEQWLPEARGRVQGEIGVSGARTTPDVELKLDGEDVAFGGHAARSVALRASIERSELGGVELRVAEPTIAGQAYESLSLRADGSRSEHRVTLDLLGGPAVVAVELQGGERDGRWRGRVQQLKVAPRDRAAWNLRAPAELAFDQGDSALRLSATCLVALEASLCAQIDWSVRGGEAQLALEALPLASLDPFLVEALDTPASAYGTLSGRIHLNRDASGAMSGEAQLRSDEGGLRLDPDAPRDWLMYRNLDLRADLDPALASVVANAQLGHDGTLAASISTEQPLAADGSVKGYVHANLNDLTFLELFGDALVAPRGSLAAELVLAGTRASPQFNGSLELRDFGAEVPAAGLALSEGHVRLRSSGTVAADIVGSVKSGAGRLTVTGRFDASAEERLNLVLRGEDFTAAAIPEVSAVVSPDLTLELRGDVLRLRGEVVVPRARIELERLQSATLPSSDVVMVDAETREAGNAMSLDSDIAVVLGDDVRLTGFGLKGKLDGRIGLRDRPGRATVARGGVQVGGEYKAYGQDLSITRGRLSYASTPLDNPALDIRAEREIDTVTVGVQVRGTALAPELTLWSEPALDQAEQLSYLVLGRPLRSASQADGAQLSQAAAAFGGNLLAQKLGARMGLDEVGVADSRALGGAALTVGKFLSPKLYVSYGVALFGSGQVVTFKYLLSRVWSVQIDSGTENRAALNYRLER